MNVIIISAMFPPIRTGTSFYSKNLAETLINNGHHVTVITAKNKELIADNYRFKVVRLSAIHFPLKNYFKHLRIMSLFPKNYRDIALQCKQDKADVVLLVNHYLDIVFPVIYAVKKNKIPLLISVGTQLQSLNKIREKILRFLDWFICGHFVYPFCRKIIAWDKEIERYINEVQKNKFNNKISIVTFGANGDVSKYKGYEHNYSLHNQIIGVGAVIDHRNFVFQVKVFKELSKKFPDLRLKIIGHIYKDDAVRLTKELGLEKKIIFMGERPHNVVLNELKASDVHWMMLDGRYKALGTSNLEAMMLGIPVISNFPKDLFGKDTLQDMSSYIYTDDYDIEAIVDKISKVMNSEDLRRSVGIKAKNFVENNMSWSVVNGQISKVLNEVKNGSL